MAGMFGYSREAVRVKVKKCEGQLPSEWRKFSVDPQITSLEVLMSILAKAFDLKADFSVSYRALDTAGQETFTAVLSDWDLDAAFLRAHNISLSTRTEPCLCLRVDMKPFSESCEELEWDSTDQSQEQEVLTSSYNRNSHAMSNHVADKNKDGGAKTQHRFQGLFMNQMERTFNMVQRALTLMDDTWHSGGGGVTGVSDAPPLPPLGDTEFRSLLDAVGRLPVPQRLRRRVYAGGVEPQLRRVVWKHVLNVYPEGMSGRERISYIKRKSAEYVRLLDTWKHVIQNGPITQQLSYVTSMVRKDVLRTDRHHPFYAGSDDNKNIASLFNILTTYALNHQVSYCQGMSDLASPLLVTMNDEAHAYICFCALMKRLSGNFMLDGIAMTRKFTHLSEAIMYYDPHFYNYLKLQQADDLLFCYRWLLLEMKREFCFEDSLRMLEVLWSSIPMTPIQTEISLYENEFKPIFETCDSPVIPRENAYTKVCALRRQSSAMNLQQGTINVKLKVSNRLNHSLDENHGRCKMKNSLLQDVKTTSLDDTFTQKKIESKMKADEVTIVENTEEPDATDVPCCVNDVGKLEERAKSVSPPLNEQSEENYKNLNRESQISSSLSSLIAHQNYVKKTGGHFKELKEKISAGKKGVFNSTDKNHVESFKPKGGRVVKNLNEFLNFNKSRISDKLIMRKGSTADLSSDMPVITLNKTSFDESESSVDTSASNKPLHVNLISKSLEREISLEGSSPDDSQEYFPMTTSMTRELRLELESLDRQVFGSDFHNKSLKFECDSPESDSISTEIVNKCECNVSKQSSEFLEFSETTDLAEICSMSKANCKEMNHTNPEMAKVNDIFLWENPLHKSSPNLKARHGLNFPTTPDEQADLEYDGDTGEIFEESHGKKSVTPIRLLRKKQTSNRNSIVQSSDSENSEDWKPIKKCNLNCNDETCDNCEFETDNQQSEVTVCNFKSIDKDQDNYEKNLSNDAVVAESQISEQSQQRAGTLPPPKEFGGGNPFLMFLCLTVLLQHRDFVMRNGMDYNEMAIHFDKMVRKHNVTRVLNQARKMYAGYLKTQTNKRSDVSV